jgi:ATP synthase protein I
LRCNTLTPHAQNQYNFRALRLEMPVNGAFIRPLSKPIRTVLRWQCIVTALLALLAGVLAGVHGALSAAMGGAVSMSAGWASAQVAAMVRKGESAGGVLVTALKAEAVKLGLIVLLLGIVLAVYGEVVVTAFIGTFVATMVIFSMALFVRDINKPGS